MKWPPLAQRRLLARITFFVVLAIVLYGGLRPHGVPTSFGHEDKLYHLAGFAALAVSARLAFPHLAWWRQVLGVLAIGAGIELVQTLEPARFGSLWDFASDAVGVAVGWLVVRIPLVRRWSEP